MPFEPYIPESYSAREDAFANRFDDVFHFHSDDADSPSKKRKRPETIPASRCYYADLPLRQYQEEFTEADEICAAREREEASESKRLYTTRCTTPTPVASKSEHHDRLPLRVRNPDQLVDYETDSEDELPKVRPAANVEGMSSPVLSDTDFEVVEGPAVVEEFADSDSDPESLVEVSHEDAGSSKVPSEHATSMRAEDSDSDWEAV